MTTEAVNHTPPKADLSPRAVAEDSEVSLISVGNIHPFRLNPRKKLGDVSELAASIRAHGILQPLVVRPLPSGKLDQYEVVAGNRRLAASKQSGARQVPCVIRELTDEEALTLALVENGQRQDVPAIEEAEAYETLNREYGLNAEAIAARTGRSVQYVQQRFRLCRLCPEVRQAISEERVTLGVALVMCQLMTEADQKAVLERVGADGATPCASVHHAKEEVGKQLHRLKQAPFDAGDPQLVPSAGSCGKCPKRTAAQGGLFGDQLDKEDRCMDSACWAGKLQAHNAAALKRLKDAGKELVGQRETAKLFDPRTGQLAYDSPYADLDMEAPQLGPKKGGGFRTLRELFKDGGAEVVVAQNPVTGKPHELVHLSAAHAALRAHKREQQEALGGKADKQKSNLEKAERERKKLEALVAPRLVEEVVAAAVRASQANALVAAIDCAIALLQHLGIDSVQKTAERRGLVKNGQTERTSVARAVLAHADKNRRAPQVLAGLLVELLVNSGGWQGTMLRKQAADALKVSVPDLVAEAKREMSAKKDAPKKAEPAKPKKVLRAARKGGKP